MPLNSPVQNYRTVAKRGFLPRLKKPARLDFLPSSVAFPKHDARKRLLPVQNNGPCVGVLKPRQDVYCGLSSIHRRILTENDREALYTEMRAKQLLNRTLTSWKNAMYLPPILLEKPTAHKSPGSFKRALESDQNATSGIKTASVATKFRNSPPLVTSEMLSISPVVLSKKPKQVSSPFTKNTRDVESSSMEEGTNRMEGRNVDEKLILSEAKRNECVGDQASQLQGQDDSVKSTRVRFAAKDSVFVFENIEM